MAGRLTTARRGRWIAAAAGLVCAGVVAWLGIHWRELHVRHLLGRLEAARTFEEATEILEAVMRHGGDARAVESFVDELGQQRQGALFWFLTYLELDAEEHCKPIPSRHHAHPCRTLPLATMFYDRAIREEGLLEYYSSYVSWRGGGCWLSLDVRLQLLEGSLHIDASRAVRAALAVEERAGSGQHDSLACLRELYPLVVAWTIGMDVRPLLAELRAPAATSGSSTARAEKLKEQVSAWLEHNWNRLTYDPATLRCKLLPDGAPDDWRAFSARGYVVPSLPFPDWKGPVPEVPGMIR